MDATPDVNPDLQVRYGTVDPAYLERLATTAPEHDGPVWMVNLMSYRERADYPDGTDHGLTGREADDRYAPFGPLAAVGAEIVFVADVDSQLLGETPPWHRVAVVKYPSRRAFVDLQDQPGYADLHVHKDAGMDRTIVMGGQPMATPEAPPDAPEWDTVPHPPTDDDPYVVVLHVLRYHDGAYEHMEAYTQAATGVAVEQGVRLFGWFAVEGTIVGDGRTWDQARFNAFPSRDAFMEVVFDPDRLAAQGEHRETAIADTYTLVLRPIIDRLRASVDDEQGAAGQPGQPS